MSTFQVPQFIDIEDKIVGPLTLRQFIIIVVSLGVIYVFFQIFEIWLWIILGGIVAALGAALAFIKINGQNFSRVATNAIKFVISPKLYVWRRPERKKELQLEQVKEAVVQKKEVKRLDLEELEKFAEKLDRR